MKQSRFTEAQIIGILKEQESGTPTSEVCRIARRECPGTIVSDNGTEFTSTAVLSWCQRTAVDWHYIAPGKPCKTGSSRVSTGASETSS